MQVGKIVGDNVYVHRSALAQSPVPEDVVDRRATHLPRDFDYQIVKWNKRTGDVSFIKSPDWDEAAEPTVGDSCKVDGKGRVKARHADPANPQIYHHKYQFVAPDYDGFNVAESRQHARDWEALHPDKSRIGYKKYWEREVLPQLTPQFSDTEMEIANRTARSHGAVGGRAVVPRYIEETSEKAERILDFGSGPQAIHTQHLRDVGFGHVEAFEFGLNQRDGVHNPQALHQEYDTVFASNVLNVQSSQHMMATTLDELAQTVKADGRLVANLPSEPRKMVIDPSSLSRMLSKRFYHVERVGGTPSAPLLEARYPRQKYVIKAGTTPPES
ncbi:MAG TPA: methyltransferase domain-containing protein [Candidatus Xenobia bacterium]